MHTHAKRFCNKHKTCVANGALTPGPVAIKHGPSADRRGEKCENEDCDHAALGKVPLLSLESGFSPYVAAGGGHNKPPTDNS